MKSRRIISIISIIIVAATPAEAARAKKSKIAEVVKSRSLDEIEQVTNYLMVRVESDPMPKGQKILKCDPTMVKVNSWLAGSARKLSDEKLVAELEEYRGKPKSYLKRVRWCADRCTCPAYARLFEAANGEMAANEEHKSNLAQLKKEMRKRKGKARSFQCAKKLDWFCESDVHNFLKGR